jgi:hypothetical protein
MRLNDLSDGSIKALLILGLLIANIAVALSHRSPDASKPLAVETRVERADAAGATPPFLSLPQN